MKLNITSISFFLLNEQCNEQTRLAKKRYRDKLKKDKNEIRLKNKNQKKTTKKTEKN